MNQVLKFAMVLTVALMAAWSGLAQTADQAAHGTGDPTATKTGSQTVSQTVTQTVVNPSGQHIVVGGQTAPVSPASEIRILNDRQKALAEETDKLLSMATELKEQVDMTSKNILSVKVVRQAEEIELYARRIKAEARK